MKMADGSLFDGPPPFTSFDLGTKAGLSALKQQQVWAMPRSPLLAKHQHRHPQVVVEIFVENDLIDIVSDGYNADIRYGSALHQGMISVPIGPRRQWVGLAAAPGYLAQRGMPHSLGDLTNHDAIRYRLPNGSLIAWRLQQGHDVVEVSPATKLVLGVNPLYSGLAYAKAGLGIIGLFANWLEGDLSAGTLVPALPDH